MYIAKWQVFCLALCTRKQETRHAEICPLPLQIRQPCSSLFCSLLLPSNVDGDPTVDHLKLSMPVLPSASCAGSYIVWSYMANSVIPSLCVLPPVS